MAHLAHVRRVLGRAWRLQCPRCGAASVFEREAGYFVGAIYINYGLTVTIALAGYFLLEAWLAPPLAWQLTLWGAFAVLFPLGSFRHSKTLWLSLDHLVDPVGSQGGGR